MGGVDSCLGGIPTLVQVTVLIVRTARWASVWYCISIGSPYRRVGTYVSIISILVSCQNRCKIPVRASVFAILASSTKMRARSFISNLLVFLGYSKYSYFYYDIFAMFPPLLL